MLFLCLFGKKAFTGNSFPICFRKRFENNKSLTDFGGLSILNNLDTTEQKRLKDWTDSILGSSQLKEVAVFDMPYQHKSDNIYYLLFASRKPVAKKIIVDIFKKAKSQTYEGQGRLDIFDKDSFNL